MNDLVDELGLVLWKAGLAAGGPSPSPRKHAKFWKALAAEALRQMKWARHLEWEVVKVIGEGTTQERLKPMSLAPADWKAEMRTYILDDSGKPIPEPDVVAWGKWMEGEGNRIVAKDTLPNGLRVSTVFLGMDHQWGAGPPLLYETMIFPPDSYDDLYQERYSTREEAIAGHAVALAKAEATAK